MRYRAQLQKQNNLVLLVHQGGCIVISDVILTHKSNLCPLSSSSFIITKKFNKIFKIILLSSTCTFFISSISFHVILFNWKTRGLILLKIWDIRTFNQTSRHLRTNTDKKAQFDEALGFISLDCHSLCQCHVLCMG